MWKTGTFKKKEKNREKRWECWLWTVETPISDLTGAHSYPQVVLIFKSDFPTYH